MFCVSADHVITSQDIAALAWNDYEPANQTEMSSIENRNFLLTSGVGLGS